VLVVNRMAKRRVPIVQLLKDVPWFQELDDDGRKVDSHKFSGPLKEPFIAETFPAADEVEKVTTDLFNLRVKKLELLKKHYSVENTDDPWFYLCLRLACDFVPGMKVIRRGPGQPAKWKGKAGTEAVTEVEALVEKGMTVPKAIAKLRQQAKWATFNEQRYYEVIKDLKKLGFVLTRKKHSR
jgi:hypothetical protein